MRKPRKLVDGAKYHVTARANRQEFILQSALIKNLFLNIIKRAKKKYKFNLTTFCIMGNHVHLMIQPLKNECLSRIMQWILSTFALNYNNTFDIKGHVWYDRFHSTVINSLGQYLHTFIYITENPVKAELVHDPGKYKYGGIWHLKRGIYDILEPPELLLLLRFPELCLTGLSN
ncbi:MAG: transposase [Spirochaetales bacterium]|nr:transposase [Spirochaetales bacterium]